MNYINHVLTTDVLPLWKEKCSGSYFSICLCAYICMISSRYYWPTQKDSRIYVVVSVIFTFTSQLIFYFCLYVRMSIVNWYLQSSWNSSWLQSHEDLGIGLLDILIHKKINILSFAWHIEHTCIVKWKVGWLLPLLSCFFPPSELNF